MQPKAISHITGGGFYENIPRSLPEGCCAKIKKSDVRVLPIFDLIAREGSVPERDMFNTFNMGVGMTITVAREDADKALAYPAPERRTRRVCAGRNRGGGKGRGTVVRAAVLVSGGGTNLQAIIDAKRAGKIPSAELALVVASNASAYALTRAETAGIAHAVLRKEKGEAPADYGERLLALLRENAIDVVVLAGFLTHSAGECHPRI